MANDTTVIYQLDGKTYRVPTGTTLDELQAVIDGPPDPNQFLHNTERSASNFARGVVDTITHPIDTLKATKDIVTGGTRAALAAANPDLADPNPNPNWQAVRDHYAQYGTLKGIGNALYEDPVGTLADASIVAGGVEGAAKLAGLPRVARAAGTASTLTNPLEIPARGANLVTNAISGATAPERATLARGLMRRALRPGVNDPERNVTRAVNTALTENLNPNARSVRRSRAAIGNLNQNVAKPGVDALTQAGVMTDIDRGMGRQFPTLRDNFQDFTPSVHMNDIEGYRNTVKQDVGNFQTQQVPTQVPSAILGPNGQPIMTTQMVPKTVRVSGEITPNEMFSRKQAQSRTMNANAWDTRKAAELEAAKSTYMGARQEILDAANNNPQVPGASQIGPAIQRESDLINWGEFALPEVVRAQSNMPIPSGVMYTAHMMGAAAGSPTVGAVAGSARGILGSPNLTSLTANTLYPRGAPTWMGKAISAFPRVNPYVRPAALTFPRLEE